MPRVTLDAVARSLAAPAPRRRLAAALALLLAPAGTARAACLEPGATCKKGTACCSGACKKKKGKKQGRCAPCPDPFFYCPPEGKCVADTPPGSCCFDSDCGDAACCPSGFCFGDCCEARDCPGPNMVCADGFCE